MKHFTYYFLTFFMLFAFLQNNHYGADDIDDEEPVPTVKKKLLKRKKVENINSPDESYRWSGRLSITNINIKSATLSGNVELTNVKAKSIDISGSVPQGKVLEVGALRLSGNAKFQGLEAGTLGATGVVYLSDSTVVRTMEVKGQLHASNVRFSHIIVQGTQIYLEDAKAENIFVLTSGTQTPRLFIKGSRSHVKNVFFLTSSNISEIKKFIKGELTQEDFFKSGIKLTAGQVIKESGTVEIIHSRSTPKYFGLSNGITIQVTPAESGKFLEFEIQLIRPTGEVVKLPK